MFKIKPEQIYQHVEKGNYVKVVAVYPGSVDYYRDGQIWNLQRVMFCDLYKRVR